MRYKHKQYSNCIITLVFCAKATVVQHNQELEKLFGDIELLGFTLSSKQKVDQKSVRLAQIKKEMKVLKCF